MDTDRAAPFRVIAQEWVSLDGLAAGPHGEADVFAAVSAEADDASQRWNDRLLDTVDEVLLGRTTYESFAGYWPEARDAIAPRVNSVPKTVASRSLTTAPWGGFASAAVAPDAVDHVRARRGGPGGRCLVWGSVSLVHALIAAGQLDELDLFVAPLLLGSGTRLVPPGPPVPLRLLESERWGDALHLRYQVGPGPGGAG